MPRQESLVLLASLVLTACGHPSPAVNVSGRWIAPPVGTVKSFLTLDLADDGKAVTGKIKIGFWPGDMPISEGRVEGNRLILIAACCNIEAKVEGEAMRLKLTVIAGAGGVLQAGTVYEYSGFRTPNFISSQRSISPAGTAADSPARRPSNRCPTC
jgi:hypothetical protein